MHIRRFLSLVLAFALTLCVVPVSAYAAEDDWNWSDSVNDHVIVPFADLVNNGLNALDSVGDTMTEIMGQNFLDTVEFWSQFFGSFSTSSYDDYVSSLDFPVIDNNMFGLPYDFDFYDSGLDVISLNSAGVELFNASGNSAKYVYLDYYFSFNDSGNYVFHLPKFSCSCGNPHTRMYY